MLQRIQSGHPDMLVIQTPHQLVCPVFKSPEGELSGSVREQPTKVDFNRLRLKASECFKGIRSWPCLWRW